LDREATFRFGDARNDAAGNWRGRHFALASTIACAAFTFGAIAPNCRTRCRDDYFEPEPEEVPEPEPELPPDAPEEPEEPIAPDPPDELELPGEPLAPEL